MIDPNLISMIGGGKQARAAKAKQHQEEEEMTAYSEDEFAQRWEYKIIRSGTGAFRHRDKLRESLEEEAQARWELVEKFDDHRVRLRRPVAARSNDHRLDFDPYRTWIGASEAGMVVRALVVSAIVGGVVLAIFLLVRM
jgi:hypothetical protein